MRGKAGSRREPCKTGPACLACGQLCSVQRYAVLDRICRSRLRPSGVAAILRSHRAVRVRRRLVDRHVRVPHPALLGKLEPLQHLHLDRHLLGGSTEKGTEYGELLYATLARKPPGYHTERLGKIPIVSISRKRGGPTRTVVTRCRVRLSLR